MTDPRLDPPAYLNDDGRRIWRETLAQLLEAGSASRVDHNSLLAYVTHVQDLNRAVAVIQSTNIIINRDGKAAPNPALQIKDQASAGIARFAKQFGLNRRNAPEGTPAPVATLGRWCPTHNRRECTAQRRGHKGLCHARAMVGVGRCQGHAGFSKDDPRHVLALERQRNPLSGEPMDIGPAEALLWRIRKVAGEVRDLDMLIADLERDELVWGKTAEVDDEASGKRMTYGARISVWVQLRSQREAVLASACEASIRAGIEERLVRTAEMHGAALYKLVTVVLTDFGVPLDDPRRAEILPRRFRELEAG
jgi:P27 family predicted phage terminase small subunit